MGDTAKANQGTGSLAPATVKKYLGLFATVLHHAVRTGLIDKSPGEGMGYVAVGKNQEAARKRVPFSNEQLRTLFASPLYTGSASLARRAKPGTLVVKDALWWTFPMTLYSGMRLEEAMGLLTGDVREVEDVLCFVVEPRPDRPLKTVSSRRLVPVHDTLLRMGLLDWRGTQPQGGLLFPALRPDKHGSLTAALSKTAGRYLRAVGMPPDVTTHSTRHAFTDALRRAKVEPEIRSRLLGHSTGTMTERYGLGHDVKALAEAVALVQYPGVKLPG